MLVDGNENQVVVGDNFDPAQIDADVVDRICTIVERAEAQDPIFTVPVGVGTALSGLAMMLVSVFFTFFSEAFYVTTMQQTFCYFRF